MSFVTIWVLLAMFKQPYRHVLNRCCAQTAVLNHPPSPGLRSQQPKTDCYDFWLKDHNHAALDKPTVQLHNPSFQPRLVGCGRVTRRQMSLNG